MRIFGIIALASATLLAGVATAAAAGDAPIVTPHAFAKGIDVSRSDLINISVVDLQVGRSAGVGISKHEFGTGVTSACDTPRIQELFCRNDN